jgi:hypothetical protein
MVPVIPQVHRTDISTARAVLTVKLVGVKGFYPVMIPSVSCLAFWMIPVMFLEFGL